MGLAAVCPKKYPYPVDPLITNKIFVNQLVQDLYANSTEDEKYWFRNTLQHQLAGAMLAGQYGWSQSQVFAAAVGFEIGEAATNVIGKNLASVVNQIATQFGNTGLASAASTQETRFGNSLQESLSPDTIRDIKNTMIGAQIGAQEGKNMTALVDRTFNNAVSAAFYKAQF